ncbi:MAG TPA: hypothetical protein VGA21_06810 [Cyclobacteriaceae bacterium]
MRQEGKNTLIELLSGFPERQNLPGILNFPRIYSDIIFLKTQLRKLAKTFLATSLFWLLSFSHKRSQMNSIAFENGDVRIATAESGCHIPH